MRDHGGRASPLTLSIMNPTGAKSFLLWRYLFIITETIVLALLMLAGVCVAFRLEVQPRSEMVEIILGTSFSILAVFLLIASPLFFKRLGWLAIAGWIIGWAVLIFGLFIPARL
jgi:hypothetical protein